jgi:hypothetical protein
MSLLALVVSIIACLLAYAAAKGGRRQYVQILGMNEKIKKLEANNKSLLFQISCVEAQAEQRQHVLNPRVIAVGKNDTINPLPTSGNNADLHDLLDQAESSLKACDMVQMQASGGSQKCKAEMDNSRSTAFIEPCGDEEKREKDYKAMREYKGSPEYQAMIKYRKNL